MKIVKLFDLRGIKIAYLILSIVANVAWVLLFLSGIDTLLVRYGDQMTGLDTTIMLGIFLGAVLIGFLVAKIAKDKRGHTYGIYGGLVGMVVAGILMRSSPLLAALTGLMDLLGNFNGATLGEAMNRRNKNSSH